MSPGSALADGWGVDIQIEEIGLAVPESSPMLVCADPGKSVVGRSVAPAIDGSSRVENLAAVFCTRRSKDLAPCSCAVVAAVPM